jgi:hypothetical protein
MMGIPPGALGQEAQVRIWYTLIRILREMVRLKSKKRMTFYPMN